MTPADTTQAERDAGEAQAATLRGIFHELGLAVLEVCDNLEREDNYEH